MPSSYSLRHLQDVCGGDHVCFLCANNVERWRVLGEFYAKGLEKNEKMMFFNHKMSLDTIVTGLLAKVPTIRTILKSGQFQFLHYKDMYLTAGNFDAEALIGRLSREVDNSLAEGYTGLRACGDMSWVHSEDNLTKKLIHYEANLNYDWPTHYSAICMYDIDAFQPDDMLQILSTHPQAVINEKLLHNIYYMPPDEYLGPNLSKAMLSRWMHNIEERKNVEERLIASTMEAEKAASSKSTFLATMSHEIRNPTNGIIGTIDMLAQTKVSKEQREYVDTIQASARHLYRVVNDVLDFSKIENGKLNMLLESIKVETLLADSISLCQYSSQKNLAVSLKYNIHPSCPDVIVGDETKLRQILVNLVGNACKFTEEGEVVITVARVDESHDSTNRNEQHSGKRKKGSNINQMLLEFAVSDTGAGIDRNNQCLLFQTFTKLDAMRKWAGTGLGLAICKQLVEAMDGHIYVKSTLGEGSTFYFQIPVSIPPADTSMSGPIPLSPSPPICHARPPSPCPALSSSPASATPLSSPSPPLNTKTNSLLPNNPLPTPPLVPNLGPPASPYAPLPAHNFSGQNVLVVEDDIINQKVLKSMLLKCMCRVTIANNGLEALKLTTASDGNPFTLIITDQYMPSMDGVTAVQHMRASMNSQGKRLCPVVVCTGTDEPRLHVVMDDVLIKPVRFNTLVYPDFNCYLFIFD